MSEFIEINWTSGSIDEARHISRRLVKEQYVACAQIIPWIESIYIWNNNVETAQESKICMKTRSENYDKIKDFILQNCKYEVPEITYKSIEGGNEEYLQWIRENTATAIPQQLEK